MDILIKEMDYEKKLALILNIKQILIRLILVLNSLSPPTPTVANYRVRLR